ncbi:serine hydrolase domain-containing protein [Streptomyces sp. NPDC056190]|uniref:serine hydrolase domain-containing protein n=1 Tax=Streptomyces sp. NPDC056190 TaxID=3345741 RepID=UPI0035E355F6
MTLNDPRLREAVDRALELGETGISVAAYAHGRLLCAAWGGTADPAHAIPVTANSLFPVFSVTKGVTALAVQVQIDRGLIDPRAPIARYWPEFAANGKETTTVRDALSHRAGIPQMPTGVTPELLADWDWMTTRIADFTPLFEPGTANAYHVLVWGWIVGEVVRRTDPAGRSFARFVRDEVLDPLGAVEFHLGVPDTELSRVAVLSGGDAAFAVDEYNVMPEAVFPGSTVHNQRVMQQAVDPGAGGITTADSVARVFGMLANGGELGGVRVLSSERVAGIAEPRDGAHDPEQILPIPVWFGANGFWLGGEPGASDPLAGDSRNMVYSPGAGGSIAWADLDRRLGVAICHNNMDAASQAAPGPDHPFTAIAEAVRAIAREEESKNG